MSDLLKNVKGVYQEYFRKALIDEEQALERVSERGMEEYQQGRIDMLEEVMKVFNSDSEQCGYKKTDSELPFPRAEWESDCGYRLCLMTGYKDGEHGAPNYGKSVLIPPSGSCTKCKKPIKAES